MRAIGVTDFLKKQFTSYEFDGTWEATFGHPEKNFKMVVYGKPGNGKTDFCIKFAKYLAGFRKVYYNSFEEGVSKSLQDAIRRNNMQDVTGKIIFGDRESFEEMFARLGRRNSPAFVFIDSRDYMALTHQQYKQLVERYPHKSFIIICWESANKPKGEHAKAMEYMADIKVHVRGFKAHPRCRYGGNEPFIIWPEGIAKNAANRKKDNGQTELQL